MRRPGENKHPRWTFSQPIVAGQPANAVPKPMPHRLDLLLNPGSIAVVGASRRVGAVGNSVMRNLLAGGYRGKLAAVNPGYADAEGVPCFARLSDLPFVAEQIIFAIADARIEAALDEAIAAGMRSCVIYSALVLEQDSDPPLVRPGEKSFARRATTPSCLLRPRASTTGRPTIPPTASTPPAVCRSA